MPTLVKVERSPQIERCLRREVDDARSRRNRTTADTVHYEAATKRFDYALHRYFTYLETGVCLATYKAK